MAGLFFLIPAISSLGISRRPHNARNVTMYNLRPYHLSANLVNKDSADAAGDIFFYITDRLLTPYACRHGSKTNPPFMCRDFQKILQTKDQVFTEIVVEVDGSFGGCPDGSQKCSQYADCNPETGNSSDVIWNCDCRAPSKQPLPKPKPAVPADFWACSAAVSRICHHDMWDPKECQQCVASHATHLPSCNSGDVKKLCHPNYARCSQALKKLGCNAYGVPKESCMDCSRTAASAEANCTDGLLEYLCQEGGRTCGATGKLAVSTRYCSEGPTTPGHLCPGCADNCGGIWAHWKSEVSRLGGIWYSTAEAGSCDNAAAVNCSWRVVKTVKTVNATCANAAIHKVVRSRDEECFEKCPQPTNTTSDCWILCFFRTLFAREPLNLTTTVSGLTPMTAAELVVPWLKAFQSEDPAEGGCPALPPPSRPGPSWRTSSALD